jgi:TetR/AcrR family transcriptional regulator, mexJK operon transcriptional repressor
MASAAAKRGARKRSANARVAFRGRLTANRIAAIDKIIVDTARTMFLSKGYAATSMQEVVTRAGVSKTALYSRYPNKSALFRAVVAYRLHAWSEPEPLDISINSDAAQRLKVRARATLEKMSSPEIQAFDRLMMTEAARFPEVAAAFHEKGYVRSIKLLAKELAAIGRANGQPTADADSIATIFTHALVGWFLTESLVRSPSAKERHTFCAKLADVLVRGRDAW